MKAENGIELDSTIFHKYENRFGGRDEKVKRYQKNLLTLKHITIDPVQTITRMDN